jgi:hypothetical protein
MNRQGEMTMAYLKTKMGALAAAAITVLAPATAAHADAQYKADGDYCMSGQASEARDLCLKEAAAADAERQKSSRPAPMPHKRHSAKQEAAATPEKSASTP